MKKEKLIFYFVFSIILCSCEYEFKGKSLNQRFEGTNKIQNLLADLSDKSQEWLINSNQESQVQGQNGIIIHINPNNLETIDRSKLGEYIKVELVEVIDKSDLIFQNLQTVSNSNIIITGGAYSINLTNNGKQLKLKKNKKLTVELPKLTEEKMELFTGERDILGQINWIPTEEVLEDKIIQPNILRIDMIRSDDRISYDTIFGHSQSNSQYEYYKLIELFDMGWINCDRFLADSLKRKDLEIVIETGLIKEAQIFAVFTEINSVTSLLYSDDKAIFRGIPESYELKIIGISLDENTLYYAEKLIPKYDKDQVKLKFESITESKLKEKIGALK